MTDSLHPDLLVKGDFILLRTALVDALGGNYEAAIVLQRIAWRCERDGSWSASREVIQEETRLSEWKVKAAIKKLRAMGWLTSERSSTWDATPRWRVITEQEDSSQSRAVESLPLDREDSSSSGVLRVGGFLPPDEEIAEIRTLDREESSRSEEEESSRSSLQTVETPSPPSVPSVAREWRPRFSPSRESVTKMRVAYPTFTDVQLMLIADAVFQWTSEDKKRGAPSDRLFERFVQNEKERLDKIERDEARAAREERTPRNPYFE